MNWEYGQSILICTLLCTQTKQNFKWVIWRHEFWKKNKTCCLCLWWQHGYAWLLCWIKASAQHSAVLSSSWSYSVIVPCKKSRAFQRSRQTICLSQTHSCTGHLLYYPVERWLKNDQTLLVKQADIPELQRASTRTQCPVVQACQQYWNLASWNISYNCPLPLPVLMFLGTICLSYRMVPCMFIAYSLYNQYFQKNSHICFIPISLSILILGCHSERFVIDQLLAVKRYFIQFCCYTGKPPSGSKLLECA